MGKGGGGGPQYSEVTQTTSNLPPYAEPFYTDLLARAGFQSSLPYEPYGGPRNAYFSPMEQAGLQRYGQLGTSGTDAELNQAGFLTNDAATRLGQMNIGSDYRAGNFSGSRYNPSSRDSEYGASSRQVEWTPEERQMAFEAGRLDDPDMLNSYMNPFYQQVVDIERREASRQGDMRRTGIGLEAAGSGSLGGYREAIEQAEMERNLMQQTGDIQARGSRDAFQNAQQAYEADRQARAMQEQFGQSQHAMNQGFGRDLEQLNQSQFGLNDASRQAQEQFAQNQFGMNSQNSQFGAQNQLNAFIANEQARQQQASLGLQAGAQNIQSLLGSLQGASQLGQFSNQRQGMELERLAALMQAGGMERGMIQQGLDTGYNDYLRQQAYPMEQLGMFSNILQGLPVTPGSTQSVYGPQASGLQQALGTGVGALGLYNAFNGNNGGGR